MSEHDLIKSGSSDYETYEELLLERDQLEKEAGQMWIAYQKEFGALIVEIYEEKIECIKCKKNIAYYQKAINCGGRVNASEMKKYLEKGMASYYSNLKKLIKDCEKAKASETSTSYEAERSKKLYLRLAKLLHPDLNPETDRSEKLKKLWIRILEAYGANDIKSLSELEVLVRRALKELGMGEIKIDIPDIEERIEELKREIETIKTTEPYVFRDLVDDDIAVENKKEELKKELEEYRKYHKELNEVIYKMIQGGELKIYVD